MRAGVVTRNWWAIVVLLAVLAGLLAYSATALPERAEAETTAQLKRSIARAPAISKVTFKTVKRGRIAATFRVRYPRIGRRTGERGFVRLRVYKDVFNQHRIASSRRYGGKLRKRLVSYKVVISRKSTVALLRRALRKKSRTAGQRAARRLVIVTVGHRRNLDRDRAIDHTWAQGSNGVGTPTKTRAKSSVLWPGSGSISIKNSLGNAQPLRLSALPGSCMAPAGITAINNESYPAPNQTVTATMYPYNTREASIPFVGQDPKVKGTLASEGQAEGVLSTLARKFAFEVWNYYATGTPLGFHGTAPKYGALIDNALPNTTGERCGVAANNLFVLGFDNLANYRHGAQLLNFDGGLKTVATLDGGQGLNTGPITGVKNSIQVGSASISDVPQPCPTYNWMTCVFPPPGSARPARDAKLSDVVWPGTHDTGTSSISTDLADLATTGGPSCGGGSEIVDKVKALVKKYVPGIANAADSVVLPIVTSKVQGLAIAQPASIREMLDNGVRYLDLRVGYDPVEGRWRFVHSMYSRGGIANDLQDIANWAKNHPTEIVIVNFNTICDTSNNTYPHLASLLQTIQQDDTLAGNVNICDRTYQAQNLAANALPNVTLQQVRNTNNNLVLMMESGIPYTPAFVSACGPSLSNSSNPVGSHQIGSFFGANDPQRLVSCGTANSNSSGFAACMGETNKRIAQLPFVASTGQPDPADSSHPNGYTMTNTIFAKDGLTMSTWRTGTPRFVIGNMHYEEITNAQIETALLQNTTSPTSIRVDGTLYDFDRPLLPGYSTFTRQDIINSWGSCANILTADDARADSIGAESVQADAYVNQAVAINLNPSAYPCNPPPN